MKKQHVFADTLSNPEFREALTRFEEQLQQKNLQSCTIRAYLIDALQFLIWLEQTNIHKLETVTSSKAQAYLDYLQSPTLYWPDGYAPSMINRKLKSLRFFFDAQEQR